MIDTHKEIPASVGDRKSYNKDLKSKKSVNDISTLLHHSDRTVNANLKHPTITT